jgi:hypothetical protein
VKGEKTTKKNKLDEGKKCKETKQNDNNNKANKQKKSLICLVGEKDVCLSYLFLP